jgi:hypothetical protein
MTKLDPKRPRCRFCNTMLREVFSIDEITREHVMPKLHWTKGDNGWTAEVTGEREVLQRVELRRGVVVGYGYDAEGFFCSAKCGYQWAVEQLRQENKSDDTRAAERA